MSYLKGPVIPQIWQAQWQSHERAAFIYGSRVYFTLFLLLYPLHYFFIDIPLHKEPLKRWLIYRCLLSIVALSGLGLSFSKSLNKSNYYRFPLAIAGAVFCFGQAQSMIWRSQVSFGYAMVIASVTAVALRLSVFSSLCFMALCYLLEMPGFLSRPDEIPYIVSAILVSVVVVSVIRARQHTDILSFVSNREQLDTITQLSKKQTAFIGFARQMAHDIRAPLMALKAAKQLPESSEKGTLLNETSERIEKIAR